MADSNLVIVQTISETVHKRLRELILSGHFKPGQWLRERELLQILGVSRTPVREALRRLEQERLLESIPHRGFRVPIPTEKEIESFYELRAELEGIAAALAAKRITTEQIDTLEEILEAATRYLRNHQSLEVIRENNRFHETVALASGNPVLLQFLQQLLDGINLYRVFSWSSNKERPPVTLNQHREILEAIRKGDSDLARRRAAEHVWDSLPLVLETVKLFQK
ncbi:GntR family transcriptional regulator [Kyrpidia sp.]|uniref:GntR family transcriptional regulator n=1 Tax=Kyrpidia sp. TaxID=2073077 RepID=UPI002588F039|nr:GntR family transcriptional regulator [Kyrpidia sp.]MCL6577495.1 GntR family transcriptional regulator [Kyrpidia sp.]